MICFYESFSRRHRKSRRISENEPTSNVNEQKVLEENQSSNQDKRLVDRYTENISEECSNATKESKSNLEEREEGSLFENELVYLDIALDTKYSSLNITKKIRSHLSNYS